ncbi:sulfatase [Marinilongibacter aquaticus]|uniref:sulfatase n=1 Tax=Marinilongibacter aquaticus TaxID=2975157 RepID=UPI0021BD2BF7|nr:sulfatase [Marinilongibacter aquaticus]UBM59806.1 sulfatase [Marinilongibacter aquaticus]
MKNTLKYLSIGCLAIALFFAFGLKPKPKPNVLFIAVDDLRPDLGCYGEHKALSPNMDQLAQEGSVFMRHYVQVPTCGASRYSMLSGLRPISRKHLQNTAFETQTANKAESPIPESFVHQMKRNGYYTVGIGKISHSADGMVYAYTDEVSDKLELPYSWSEMLFDSGKWKTGWNAFFAYANGENRQSMQRQVKPYEAGKVGDEGYPDGLTAELAIKKLKELKNNEQPFFMGLGFFKPHLPFNSPEKYWDNYDREKIAISDNPDLPQNVNLASLQSSGELNGYQLTDEKPSLQNRVSDEYARKLRQAYYSAISYSDTQIGKVLTALKELGLDENTIVVLWGDHGWHLGDQQTWGKHTLFENALRSALIVKLPHTHTEAKIESIVESVDIYPTLMELCDIPVDYQLDGKSLVPLLKGEKAKEKNKAYSYFKSGISLRTDRYRLTKYFRKEEPNIELYDHLADPNESINIAASKPEIVSELMPILEAGNTGLYQ